MITLQEIVAATGGKCDFSGNPDFTGINTDTRSIKNGELFIALKGENFDGHAYVVKAAENGAAGILASRKADVEGIPVIYVKDTLKGYQDIAHADGPGFHQFCHCLFCCCSSIIFRASLRSCARVWP